MAAHRWDPRAPLPRDLVVPVRVGDEGGPTRRQAGGATWRRTSWGHRVPAEVDGDDVVQRIVEIAPRLMGSHQVTGWAALRLRGAQFFDGLGPRFELLPIDLVIGRKGNLRQRDGVRLSRTPTDPDGTVIGGVRVVSVGRAVVDVMRMADGVWAAVIEVEKAYAAELISRREIASWLARGPRLHGLSVVREALALSRENARSPKETEARLTAELEAGLPPLHVNATVVTAAGREIGEVDLFDEEAGLAIEVDGAEHRNAKRQARDVVKDDLLRDCGIEVIRLTGNQTSGPQAVERLLAARARAKFLPAGRRARRVVPRPEDLAERRIRAAEETAYFARMEEVVAEQRARE